MSNIKEKRCFFQQQETGKNGKERDKKVQLNMINALTHWGMRRAVGVNEKVEATVGFFCSPLGMSSTE